MTAPASRIGERGTLGLWYGVLGGALAWTTHLLLSHALLPVACATGLTIILHGVTLACAAITAAAGRVAFRRWREQPSPAPAEGRDQRANYRRYMTLCGVVLSAIFLVAILLEGLPVLFLSPCL